jgi:hypothetical protein
MINYQLPMTNRVLLKVYDILGQEITTLVDQPMSAGKHQLVWDAENWPSGIYVYRLKAGNYIKTRKMILMK